MARRTITLTELISDVREKGDYESSSVFTDSILTKWINEAIAEVYDDLIKADPDLYTTQATLTTSAGVGYVALPDDLYKLVGLKMASTGHDLSRVTIQEFGKPDGWSRVADEPYRYRRQGRIVYLLPEPAAADDLTLYYIPWATKLVSGSDTWDGINGFERLVVDKVLYLCDSREERPTAERERRIQKGEADIAADAAHPDRNKAFSLVRRPRARWGE